MSYCFCPCEVRSGMSSDPYYLVYEGVLNSGTKLPVVFNPNLLILKQPLWSGFGWSGLVQGSLHMGVGQTNLRSCSIDSRSCVFKHLHWGYLYNPATHKMTFWVEKDAATAFVMNELKDAFNVK